MGQRSSFLFLNDYINKETTLCYPYVIAGGYKLHAKMPTNVYSSYVRCGVFSSILQLYNL